MAFLGPLVLMSAQTPYLIVLVISGLSPFSKPKLPWKMVISLFFAGIILIALGSGKWQIPGNVSKRIRTCWHMEGEPHTYVGPAKSVTFLEHPVVLGIPGHS